LKSRITFLACREVVSGSLNQKERDEKVKIYIYKVFIIDRYEKLIYDYLILTRKIVNLENSSVNIL